MFLLTIASVTLFFLDRLWYEWICVMAFHIGHNVRRTSLEANNRCSMDKKLIILTLCNATLPWNMLRSILIFQANKRVHFHLLNVC